MFCFKKNKDTVSKQVRIECLLQAGTTGALGLPDEMYKAPCDTG